MGVPERAVGHEPQQEEALFAVGGWRVAGNPAAHGIRPATPRMTTCTQSQSPQPSISMCVYSQSHTHRPACRGTLHNPSRSQLYSFKQLCSLTYHCTHRLPPRNITTGSHTVLVTHNRAMPCSPAYHWNPAAATHVAQSPSPVALPQCTVRAHCPEAHSTESTMHAQSAP